MKSIPRETGPHTAIVKTRCWDYKEKNMTAPINVGLILCNKCKLCKFKRKQNEGENRAIILLRDEPYAASPKGGERWSVGKISAIHQVRLREIWKTMMHRCPTTSLRLRTQACGPSQSEGLDWVHRSIEKKTKTRNSMHARGN